MTETRATEDEAFLFGVEGKESHGFLSPRKKVRDQNVKAGLTLISMDTSHTCSSGRIWIESHEIGCYFLFREEAPVTSRNCRVKLFFPLFETGELKEAKARVGKIDPFSKDGRPTGVFEFAYKAGKIPTHPYFGHKNMTGRRKG